MSEFEDFADAPTPDEATREASGAAPEHDDGQLSMTSEELEADLESHVVEVWYAELQEERELLEATSLEDLFTVPTHMVPDQSVMITVVDEPRGHLPKWGCTRDPDAEEACYAPLCPM
eukprot:8679545-Pyramimonas_sp.AAC.1